MELIKTKKFITNSAGRKTDVILDMRTYEKLLNDLEEFYIIREYDKAKRKTDAEIKSGNFTTLENFINKRNLKRVKKNAK